MIYDFDDIGVPQVFPENRRQDTTAYRMKILEEHENKKEAVILFGQIIPDEIISNKENILFVFLDVPREEIKDRLSQRGRETQHIDSYHNRDQHIKKSVLNQANNFILQTNQDIEICTQLLIKKTKDRTNNK